MNRAVAYDDDRGLIRVLFREMTFGNRVVDRVNFVKRRCPTPMFGTLNHSVMTEATKILMERLVIRSRETTCGTSRIEVSCCGEF